MKRFSASVLKSSNGILFQQRFFVIIVLRVGVEERFLTDDAFYSRRFKEDYIHFIWKARPWATKNKQKFFARNLNFCFVGMGIKGKKLVVLNLNHREEAGNSNWLPFHPHHNENNDSLPILSIRDRASGNYCAKASSSSPTNPEWTSHAHELPNLNIIC